jgi:hypothetical protein
MMLNGKLRDFPVPEVMLFIGKRVGRLCLLDVPNSAEVAVDLADGRVHALHLAGSTLTDPNEMITVLSVIVEAGDGKFEFGNQPIQKRQDDESIEVNHLVMSLVVHIDVRLTMKRSALSPNDVYTLVEAPPDIAIDRGLKFFYDQSEELLRQGVQSSDLAEALGLEPDVVILHLSYLRQLGFIKIVGLEETKNLPSVGVKKVLHRKTTGYQYAAEASELLVRTGKLIMKSGKLWKVPPRDGSAVLPVED